MFTPTSIDEVGRKRAHEADTTSLPSNIKLAKKRVRTGQACSHCRVLRRKCNAQSPCAACEDDNLACSYDGDKQPAPKVTLARAIKRIAYLEERLQLYEGTSSSEVQHHGHRVLQGTDGNLASLWLHNGANEDMSHALRGINHLKFSPRMPEFYGGSSSEVFEAVRDEGPDSHQDAMENGDGGADLSSPENRAHLWLGSKSGLTFGKAAGALLPPQAVAADYVNRYFQTAHHIFPILNRKLFVGTFDDYYKGLPTEGQGYEFWTAVMFMVIALGHQYSLIDPDEEVRKRALASSQDGEVCYQLAKSSLSEIPFAGGDISAVNSLLLAFLWLYNQHRLHEGYMVLGVAARIGYSIGLHRDLKMDPGQDPNIMPHIVGWCSSFWCLFTYEREMVALLGRPCAIEAREVDIKAFNLEASPVDLQYLERMRQFSYVTWDAYDHVYSLSVKHASVSERGDALRKTDKAFESWFSSWFPECPWAKEPHGLVIRLRFLHMRLLFYRAFLNLFVRGARRREKVSEDLQELATVCIHIAVDIVTLTLDTIHPGVHSSGTLQGVLFHAMSYLWNALVTLLFLTSSQAAQEILKPKLRPISITREIRRAVQVYEAHAQAVSFSQTAQEKIQTILERIDHESASSRDTTGDAAAGATATIPEALTESTMLEVELDWLDGETAFDDFEAFFGIEVDHNGTRGACNQS